MAGFAWFQEGTTYGAADMANWNALLSSRGPAKHLFASTNEFLLNSDQTARTVDVGSGNALVGHPINGATWAWTPGVTVAVPTPSNVNPRRDLIIARLRSTANGDPANGFEVELLEGTPAASPSAPARPDNAVALGWVDVPKSTTTFTITPVRITGQYQDQMLSPAPGTVAVDWAGQLPLPDQFRPGAACVDLSTGQRWVRTKAGEWFTTDPGPWKACTLQNFTNAANATITVTGWLYVRESSTCWELSGTLTFAPGNTAINKLVNLGALPASATKPRNNTYGTAGSSYTSTSGGTARVGLMSSGAIEFGSIGVTGNAYINESFSKSPVST
ncbi:hypothetical protein AB0M39_33400 [Streptomyces sp. NPDC051907]|uniref:hypothetical protein n=1 Tax=Streptomyces sp. NPDC051907 TaxID=3155284 RepID=UPI00341C54A5